MWINLVGPDGVFCLFSHYHILSTLRPHYPACMQLQYNNLTHTHSPQRRGDDGPTSRVDECTPYDLRGQIRKVLALPPTTNPSSALTDIHGLQLNLVRLWCHLSSLSLSLPTPLQRVRGIWGQHAQRSVPTGRRRYRAALGVSYKRRVCAPTMPLSSRKRLGRKHGIKEGTNNRRKERNNSIQSGGVMKVVANAVDK